MNLVAHFASTPPQAASPCPQVSDWMKDAAEMLDLFLSSFFFFNINVLISNIPCFGDGSINQRMTLLQSSCQLLLDQFAGRPSQPV